MRTLVFVAVLVTTVVVPVWAWDPYGPVYGPSYSGSGSELQLRAQVDNLERQLRELRRDVDRLRGSPSSGMSNSAYPLPGQAVHGFRPVRGGAYEMSINGTVLRIDRNGDLSIHAAGKLSLEGQSVITNSREGAGKDSQPASKP